MNDDFKEFVIQFHLIAGIDLSYYNQAQVLRRLTGFMTKRGFLSLSDLLSAVQADKLLLQDCLKKLTINVTDFFRDREYWDVLRANISNLAKQKLPLKMWSAGCATGEEAYSLAYLAGSILPLKCWELIASDVDSKALTAAMAGIYPEKSIKNLNPLQTGILFYKVGSFYQVKERFRQQINFIHHDLLQDIYPDNLDLVLCRNVLIYFNEAAKKQVLNRIAQSLNPGGLLFIGGSEQIMAPEDIGLIRDSVYFYKKK